MNQVLVIQSSPNECGLTASLARAAREGAQEQGARVALVHLNSRNIGPCAACGDGWGHHFAKSSDRSPEECILKDDFADLRQQIIRADGLVFCSPVYFWDLSESAKTFLDRLRRCHYPVRTASPLKGKPVVSIAAAGGSGNGAVEAARVLEDYFLKWMDMRRVATLPVTRQTAEMHLEAAHSAAKLLVEATTA